MHSGKGGLPTRRPGRSRRLRSRHDVPVLGRKTQKTLPTLLYYGSFTISSERTPKGLNSFFSISTSFYPTLLLQTPVRNPSAYLDVNCGFLPTGPSCLVRSEPRARLPTKDRRVVWLSLVTTLQRSSHHSSTGPVTSPPHPNFRLWCRQVTLRQPSQELTGTETTE